MRLRRRDSGSGRRPIPGPAYDAPMTTSDPSHAPSPEDATGAGAVRTRFAPSPTGYLHVGTARTALFNYLFARRNGGTFILRIEDTALDRNVEGGEEALAEVLRWLGLDWDEGYGVGGPHGPYVQTQRLDRYRAAVDRMLAEGTAYRCWCTPAEIEARAAARREQGLTVVPGYDRHCRDLPEELRRAYEAEGRVPAVRFRMPTEGVTVVDDLVRGRVEFENAFETDRVILRPSGIPTYQLAVVYDDVDMDVTHVIRGEDLFPSTPMQIHVAAALGRTTPPAYAHLPLLVGADRKKLSKRFGDVALESFRAKGYLPEAMVNYLALLGWSFDDHTEFFSLDDLERAFSIERVTRNPAMFDTVKLDAINAQHLRALSPAEFAERAMPFVRDAGYVDRDGASGHEDLATLERAAPLVQERVTRLDEVPGMVGFLYSDEVALDPADAAKALTDAGMEFLGAATKALEELPAWTAESIEATLRNLQQERGIGARKAFQPIRLAITGRLVSPPLFESMALLGRERSLRRLAAATTYAAPAEKPGSDT
jgi:glutamyl-tRNA synthetase